MKHLTNANKLGLLSEQSISLFNTSNYYGGDRNETVMLNQLFKINISLQ